MPAAPAATEGLSVEEMTMMQGDETEDDGIARQRALGAELKRVFGSVVEEQLPERLQDLAARLESMLAQNRSEDDEAPAPQPGETRAD